MIQLLLNNDLSLKKPEKAKVIPSYVSKHFDANVSMQIIDFANAVVHLVDDNPRSHTLLLTKGIL
jgi:hypothetical protein